ncbi:MAG: ATP-binding cassette domain-containing protein [Oscillospiraceae bacterium]|jgi:putative ABC transport system ATP-binding protein|nr:ATP-binding cassette domain-containing protein [Oscillospiraceae bacterium]
MLTIKNARITFNAGTVNERKALDKINLSFARGSFTTVIGSNGAGKSTLLNAISGAYALDSGHIFLDGEEITEKPEHFRARIIGRLFQDPLKGTAPNMTIEENLALAYGRGTRRGLSIGIRKADGVFFKEALSRLGLGLEDRLKSKVGLLSGGQRQALTLLMATIVPPKLLLLDEHTAALDPQTAAQVMRITGEFVRENNITTIMVTHNIDDALHTGDSTIVLSNGRLVLTLEGVERESMTVERLMKVYSAAANDSFGDSMLL